MTIIPVIPVKNILFDTPSRDTREESSRKNNWRCTVAEFENDDDDVDHEGEEKMENEQVMMIK